MIEVSAKLVGGPVYLPGESIGCCISFSNPPVPSDTRSRSNRDVLETLAWASAQIHCLQSTSDKINFPPIHDRVIPEEVSISSSDTSFAPCRGDRGRIVLSTKPKILFCDLRLSPGESKTYLYTEVLPSESPPSYRGQLVKYSYKITVGTQRVNCPIKQLRVPLRILVFSGIPEAIACEESVDLSPSNPFLESNDKTQAQDIVVQMMQNITARRSPNFFNITNMKGKVARFCLFKQAYKLGEDIVGTFDFVGASVPCVQFTVTLQCEELISDAYKSLAKQDRAVISYSVCHEVCLSMQQCVLNLPIPLYVTPAFDTDIISLRWRLHFEFVTTDPVSATLNSTLNTDSSTVYEGPASLPIETMVWDLPIQIYPTILTPDPQSQTKYNIII
ncbi:RAB6A-GEF complex partner protein 2 isoform X2 [Lycorma delicatula]|uniref:RAB6A-GEF complex partner protein 2 isoform X2 n=1 Tax=Lycorma delicatula TaxID=130591 RepID=UPI003F50E00A